MYKPARLPSMQGPAKAKLEIDTFLGADLTNSPENVKQARSPNCPNMIRDVPGKVRKRMGYEKALSLKGRINGRYALDEKKELIHAGTALYKINSSGGTDESILSLSEARQSIELTASEIYEGLADEQSSAWEFDKKLFIADGKQLLVYDGEKVNAVSEYEKTHVPVFKIACDPKGIGTEYEGVNMLTPKYEQRYAGVANQKTYQLSLVPLSKAFKVKAEVLKSDGSWGKAIVEGEGLSVKHETGLVTFVTAPGASPVTGEDNIKIFASRDDTHESEADESFEGAANKKEYQLSTAPLSDKHPVWAELLQADNTWLELREGISADYKTGLVTFEAAPGAAPVSGQKNIKIHAWRCNSKAVENLLKINLCKIGIQYGVNGANDRLFLSGNEKYKNYDWFSQFNDPTYFADLSYCVLGQSDSAIMGYSIINAKLAAHKDGQDAQRNVIVREGKLSDGKPVFPIVNIIQGEGAVGQRSFAYIANEPVFLTRLGVYAITAQDMTGEKYSQCRSFFLNGKLLKENLRDAYACVYRDMYFLCFSQSGWVYILDGLQAVQADRGAPYSTRQYAGFYLTDIYARCMWESAGTLWFGNENGEVLRFFDGKENIKSFSDDGRPIYAAWQTPELWGATSYRNKSYSRLYMSLGASAATGVKALSREGGIWEEIFSDYSSARFFSFAQLCFSKLSFSGDATPRTLGGKIRIKKVDKAGFKLENSELNEPFSLNSISLEFKETGYYKGR